jgi:hypothetical protein
LLLPQCLCQQVVDAAALFAALCGPAGVSLAQLPQLVPQLTSLDVSGCGGLSGDDLAQLLGQMKHLERLVLDGIEEVGEIFVPSVYKCITK